GGVLEYDLADNWSNTDNPNGPWRFYKNVSVLFDVLQPNWCNDPAPPYQIAWADQPVPLPGHVPQWMRYIGPEGCLGDFADAGTVVVHGAETEQTRSEYTSAGF